MIITLIIDVSGSMYDKLKETQKGVRTLAKQNPKALFNLIEFGTNDGVEVIYKKKKAKKLLSYKAKSISSTPMWDGIGTGLSLIDIDEKNMVVIITDGDENTSTDWKTMHIKPLLKAQEAAGVELIYMGVDVNTVEIQESLGIRSHRIMSYNNTSVGANAAFDVAASFADSVDMDMSSADIDCALDRKSAELDDIKIAK